MWLDNTEDFHEYYINEKCKYVKAKGSHKDIENILKIAQLKLEIKNLIQSIDLSKLKLKESDIDLITEIRENNANEISRYRV